MTTDRKNTIYLTGFMGSGKSTLGPILANTLGFAFVDLDGLIEQHASKTVTRIFAEDGETAFRALESSTLISLSAKERTVVSLGGGTLVNPDNLRLVKEHGILIYLKTDPDQIAQRMKNKTDRPLLRGPNGEQLSDKALRERIGYLIEQREKYYLTADIVVSTTRRKVGSSVDEIVQKLRAYVV